MKGVVAIVLAILFLAARTPCVMPSPMTVPAFLWSPHGYGSSHSEIKEVVDYRTISSEDLAKSVLSEGGWSNLVCSGNGLHQNVDVALVYVGRKLQSSDISKAQHADPTLVNLLKTSFTSSNVSIAFPYVTITDGKNTLENSLISAFVENCGNGLGVNHIAYLESCSIDGKNLQKLQGQQSFKDFVSSKMMTEASGQTDLVIFCDEGFQESDQAESEGKTLSALVNFLEKLGASYSVLYASDPSRSLQSPHLAMRLLAENTSSNSTRCDGVCQLKSSLLEGLFVAIVLLIILISGLCCMMGIDTPSRFEAPQES